MFLRGSIISSPSSTAAFAPRIVKVRTAEATRKPPVSPAKRGEKFWRDTCGAPAPIDCPTSIPIRWIRDMLRFRYCRSDMGCCTCAGLLHHATQIVGYAQLTGQAHVSEAPAGCIDQTVPGAEDHHADILLYRITQAADLPAPSPGIDQRDQVEAHVSVQLRPIGNPFDQLPDPGAACRFVSVYSSGNQHPPFGSGRTIPHNPYRCTESVVLDPTGPLQLQERRTVAEPLQPGSKSIQISGNRRIFNEWFVMSAGAGQKRNSTVEACWLQGVFLDQRCSQSFSGTIL